MCDEKKVLRRSGNDESCDHRGRETALHRVVHGSLARLWRGVDTVYKQGGEMRGPEIGDESKRKSKIKSRCSALVAACSVLPRGLSSQDRCSRARAPEPFDLCRFASASLYRHFILLRLIAAIKHYTTELYRSFSLVPYPPLRHPRPPPRPPPPRSLARLRCEEEARCSEQTYLRVVAMARDSTEPLKHCVRASHNGVHTHRDGVGVARASRRGARTPPRAYREQRLKCTRYLDGNGLHIAAAEQLPDRQPTATENACLEKSITRKRFERGGEVGAGGGYFGISGLQAV